MKSAKALSVAKNGSIRKQAGANAWPVWFASMGILFLTVIAFLPTLRNEFVDWDDDMNLITNLNYRGFGWAQLGWMFTTFHMGHYQPLSWATFALDYLLWGMKPFGYHLTNLLLHAANAVLFYLVTLRLLAPARIGFPAAPNLGLRVAAGFAALLFSVHPLRVESVAWATERRDVLSASFLLLTVLCYLRAATETSAGRRPSLTLAVVCYGLSLLSKASGMVLPVVLVILDVYPLRRLGGAPEKWFGAAARRIWWEKAPFLLLAIPFGVIALFAQREAGALVPLGNYGVTSRLAQACFSISFYLWKTVAPLRLSPLYPAMGSPKLWDGPFLLSGLAVLGITIGLWALRRRWPAGLASWSCYVAIIAPVSGIAQSGVQFVADRYSYLSSLAWAALAGAGLASFWKLWMSGRIGRPMFLFANGLAAAIVLSLGMLTWYQSQVWHDTVTLWRQALAIVPESTIAHNELGNALLSRGELDEAIDQFRQAADSGH